MSMVISLHPCDERPDVVDGVYSSSSTLELCSWLVILKDIVENSKPIDKPVRIQWSSRQCEVRAVKQVDTSCTWLVDAEVLKMLSFYKPSWHPDRVAEGRRFEEVIEALPDDWPVIVRYG